MIFFLISSCLNTRPIIRNATSTTKCINHQTCTWRRSFDGLKQLMDTCLYSPIKKTDKGTWETFLKNVNVLGKGVHREKYCTCYRATATKRCTRTTSNHSHASSYNFKIIYPIWRTPITMTLGKEEKHQQKRLGKNQIGLTIQFLKKSRKKIIMQKLKIDIIIIHV